MTSLQKLIQHIENTKKEVHTEVATSGTVEVPKKISESISRNLGKGYAYSDIRNPNSTNLHH